MKLVSPRELALDMAGVPAEEPGAEGAKIHQEITKEVPGSWHHVYSTPLLPCEMF